MYLNICAQPQSDKAPQQEISPRREQPVASQADAVAERCSSADMWEGLVEKRLAYHRSRYYVFKVQ